MRGDEMEIIKKNLVVIFIVLTLLVMILIRSTGIHFMTDAKSHALATLNQSNTITVEKFESLEGDKLFVNLGGDINNSDLHAKEMMNVSPDSILIKSHLNAIMKYDGTVVLYSSEPAVSARIWMLLSQLGRKNIFIFTNADNEILKYKFHPDSLSQSELKI